MADSGDSAVYIAVGMSIVAVLLAVGVTYTIKTVKRVRAVAKAAPVPEIEAPQAAEKARIMSRTL